MTVSSWYRLILCSLLVSSLYWRFQSRMFLNAWQKVLYQYVVSKFWTLWCIGMGLLSHVRCIIKTVWFLQFFMGFFLCGGGIVFCIFIHWFTCISPFIGNFVGIWLVRKESKIWSILSLSFQHQHMEPNFYRDFVHEEWDDWILFLVLLGSLSQFMKALNYDHSNEFCFIVHLFLSGASKPFEAIFVSRQSKKNDVCDPLIVVLHGGPHSVSLSGFAKSYAFLSSLGYSLLIVNYRCFKAFPFPFPFPFSS